MEIQTIGLAGLGLLGRGIAACLLAHGRRVIAFTRHASTHAAARQHVDQAIAELVERGGFPAGLAAEWPGQYEPVDAIEAFAPCDFVIESVAEDLAAKQQVFDRIEAVVRPETPVASNTSAIPVHRLQEGRLHPERFLAMHWAEPAHVTRFMELVPGEKTSEAAVRAAQRLARSIGKEPCLVQKDVPGFIVNRLGYALYREALNLLEMGVADAPTIDRACRNALGLWATLCGPFRWMDLTGGPALYARAMRGVLPTLSTTPELPATMAALEAAGAQGTAGGQGFYEYAEEDARRWEALLRDHAWTVRRLLDSYFPLDDPCD